MASITRLDTFIIYTIFQLVRARPASDFIEQSEIRIIAIILECKLAAKKQYVNNVWSRIASSHNFFIGKNVE
jgi:hypothetical protein